MSRELSLSGMGTQLKRDAPRAGCRALACPKCNSILEVDDQTYVGAPLQCCVCWLVFYPIAASPERTDPHGRE